MTFYEIVTVAVGEEYGGGCIGEVWKSAPGGVRYRMKQTVALFEGSVYSLIHKLRMTPFGPDDARAYRTVA